MTHVSVEQLRFDRNRILLMMDDVEMALQLADLAESTTVKDQELTPEFPFYPVDFQSEFYSAASMVLDREEIEALEKESSSLGLEPCEFDMEPGRNSHRNCSAGHDRRNANHRGLRTTLSPEVLPEAP